MVTVASFRAHHPEMTTAPPDAVVQDAIDKAGRILDATVIPATVYDDAVEWQVYVILAVSPYSRDKRVSVTEDMLAGARACLDDIIRGAGRVYRVLP
ncbi:hypothetical protein [Zavarzinia sp.]|uniref:hypothetical protein n=1 Tax=Zavarzinia sp. TaxID=2027920 RepID=UPI00356799D5